MIPRTSQPLVVFYSATPHGLPLWRRWVMANALGELLGLGLVAAVAGGLIGRFGEPRTTITILLLTMLMILLGACEGLVLGWAQWSAMKPFLSALTRWEWVSATMWGAVVAWGLGMIPSTMFALQATTNAAPPPSIDDTTKYFMAAIMGLGLGVVLGVPQWMVLRRYVNRAGGWVGANAVAWAVGMPIVFFGAGSVPAQASGALLVLLIALTLFVAGAVVGAIHGCALVCLLQRQQAKGNV